MIPEVISNWEKNKQLIQQALSVEHPDNYASIVKLVVQHVGNLGNHGKMNAERIHEIDEGDYQGTTLFIIPRDTYQPSDFWYVFVEYGSCSSCDTLEGIKDLEGKRSAPPTPRQVDGYMTLALHIVQRLKKMDT